MKHQYSASVGRIKIIPLSESDSQRYRQIRNREENRKKFIYSEMISEESQTEWYAKYEQLAGDYMFAVYSDSQFLGGNAVYNMEEKTRTAEYGRLLIDKTACSEGGRGYEATIAALHIAFLDMKLKKIHLEVYIDNIPAYKIYLKSGFKVKELREDPEGRAMYYMEITADEFMERKGTRG